MLPRISQPIKITFVYTGTETPTQADLDKGRHLFGHVIETIDVIFAAFDAASFRHMSVGSSVFWPHRSCLPSWVDFIVHGYPSSKLPFLKSPNQAQERMAMVFRNPGERLGIVLAMLAFICYHYLKTALVCR